MIGYAHNNRKNITVEIEEETILSALKAITNVMYAGDKVLDVSLYLNRNLFEEFSNYYNSKGTSFSLSCLDEKGILNMLVRGHPAFLIPSE